MKKPKRPTAMNFLEESKEDFEDSDDEIVNADNCNGSPYSNERLSMTLRANSPSPIRKRGSLLDLFNNTNIDASKALTQFKFGAQEKPRKLTAREVDASYEGDIPNTPLSELPPAFNEIRVRKNVMETLLNERVEHYLGFFYNEMNETAIKHGLKKSNFAVAHGMHHYNNYSSALDIARLSRIALTAHSFLVEIVNTKQYDMNSRINCGFTYSWKNTNLLLWQQD